MGLEGLLKPKIFFASTNEPVFLKKLVKYPTNLTNYYYNKVHIRKHWEGSHPYQQKYTQQKI